MKKVMLLIALCIFCNISYGQKKPAKKPAASSASVLAKSDNLTAEFIGNNLYLFVQNKSSRDTILLKRFDKVTVPVNPKIAKFSAKGAPLYSVSWSEVKRNETKLKTEEATTICTEICDIEAKSKVLSNAQTTTRISEIVYLDKNKTVSETQDRIRREGFEYIQLPNGDIVLKNKTQENKMTYNPAERKFVNANGSTAKKK